MGYDYSLLAMLKYNCSVQILERPRNSLLAMSKYSYCFRQILWIHSLLAMKATVSVRYCMISEVSVYN